MSPFQKRFHRKSRHGCSQCKNNKVKCDELKPTCSRCVRTGTTCSFTGPNSGLIVIHTPQSHVSSSGRGGAGEVATVTPKTTCGLDRTVTFSDFSMDPHFSSSERDRLKLIHHYTNFTSKSIIELTLNDGEGVSLWLNHVPQLAFEHDFLLHGLLSVSSLHLALCGQSENITSAIRHHHLGIELFRPYLSNITADKVGALLAFSCLLALYSFGIHRIVKTQLSPLAKITEVFNLVRGSGVIIQAGGRWVLEDGPWKPFFQSGDVDFSRELPAEMEAVLSRLLQRSKDTALYTTSQRLIYSMAIEVLRRNFVLATSAAHVQLTINLFPVMVQYKFLEFMRLGEPLALAILANYAVVLHWLRSHIWLEGWGQQTINAVGQALPHDWHDCIAWAIQEVRSGQVEASSNCKDRPRAQIMCSGHAALFSE